MPQQKKRCLVTPCFPKVDDTGLTVQREIQDRLDQGFDFKGCYWGGTSGMALYLIFILDPPSAEE